MSGFLPSDINSINKNPYDSNYFVSKVLLQLYILILKLK